MAFRSRLRASTAARFELARAIGDLIAWIPRFVWYLLVSRRGHERRVRADLDAEPCLPIEPAGELHWHRAPRFLLAAAEESGETHLRNLARAIRSEAQAAGLPAPELCALGSPGLAAEGMTVLADPVPNATLHAKGIAGALPFYVGLLRTAGECFRGDGDGPGIDRFVPVDSPALFVPMARIARGYGVPSWHFIAPQFWGWAPWRVGRYRRNVAHAFTILPFEPHWYARHRVAVTPVGHPLLDELAHLPPPPAPRDAARTRCVLLPGSRGSEIEDNLAWMLDALAPLAKAAPSMRFVIAQQQGRHAERIQAILASHPAGARVALEIGDLHGTLRDVRIALAVSGTVLTDLLVHRIPAVVIYRDPGGWKGKLKDRLLTTGFFASTNLVAGRAVLPEYCFGHEGPLAQVGQDLVDLGLDGDRRDRVLADLDEVAHRLGGPGACRRTARALLLDWTQDPKARLDGAGPAVENTRPA
ncbi:MAG: hypothetical protein R3F33_12045 [Planctomycetota bacterium]